jgi:hypothetical protein
MAPGTYIPPVLLMCCTTLCQLPFIQLLVVNTHNELNPGQCFTAGGNINRNRLLILYLTKVTAVRR